jgi:hypothetical protein
MMKMLETRRDERREILLINLCVRMERRSRRMRRWRKRRQARREVKEKFLPFVFSSTQIGAIERRDLMKML